MSYRVNELATKKQPTEAAFGRLAGQATPESVAAALVAAGIDADRIYFLIGPEGAEVLRSTISLFTKLFDDVIQFPIEALDAGDTLVGVFGTDRDDLAAVRKTLTDAGVTEHHYFGKWTYS